MQAADQAKAIRDQLPQDGLFAGHEWRMPVEAFPLEEKFSRDLKQLGRVCYISFIAPPIYSTDTA